MEAGEVIDDIDDAMAMEESQKGGSQGFRRYSEITNYESGAKYENILNEGFGDSKVEWVMTEKVHGANFSFLCDGKSVVAAKRTSLLTDTDKFYGHQRVLEEHQARVLSIFQSVRALWSDAESIVIYGELYGGIYPHPDVPKVPNVLHVQKGVFYSPTVQFIAFDIWVKDHSFVDFDTFARLCEQAHIDFSRSLDRGTLLDLMKFDVETFTSTIPALFGLPPLDRNIAEGVVLKPVRNCFLSGGDRVIVKKKSDAFKEVSGLKNMLNHKPKRAEGAASPPSPLEEDMLRYVTDNRLRAVISKIGAVPRKDLPKLIGLLAQDALKDFSADSVSFSVLPKEEQRPLTKALQAACKSLIERNSKAILDGDF